MGWLISITIVQQVEQNKKIPQDIKDKLDEVGFSYFLIILRLTDIDPALVDDDGQLQSGTKVRDQYFTVGSKVRGQYFTEGSKSGVNTLQ